MLQVHKVGAKKRSKGPLKGSLIAKKTTLYLMNKAPEGTEYPENSENLDDRDCPRADELSVYHWELEVKMDGHSNWTYSDAAKKILVLIPIQLKRRWWWGNYRRYNTDTTLQHSGRDTNTRQKRRLHETKISNNKKYPECSSFFFHLQAAAISDENGFQGLIRFIKSQFQPNFKPLCHWGNSVLGPVRSLFTF